MSRVTVLFLVLVCVGGIATAQITIHQGDFAAVGSAFATHTSNDNVTVNLGSGGANQTWSVPDQTWTLDAELWVTPTGTQYADSFPTANYCETNTAGDQYQYYRLASNGFFQLGFAGNQGGQFGVFVYHPEAMLLPLPLSYPGNWTGVAHATMEIQPGINATIVDSTIYVVDGWGSMSTPFGTWPMLRIQQHRYEKMWLMGIPMDSSESYDYLWMGQNPPLRVEIGSQGSSNPNFTTGRIRIVTPGGAGAEPPRGPVAERFNVGQNYPNPFNPSTMLPVQVERPGMVNVSVYDETGRLVYTLNAHLEAGTNNLPIDGSQWATGTYFARVTEGVRSMTQKMMLLK